jgi:hypothetical protein
MLSLISTLLSSDEDFSCERRPMEDISDSRDERDESGVKWKFGIIFLDFY